MAIRMATKPTENDYGPIRPRHVLMLLTLATVWGTSFMVIKIGVAHVSALDLTAMRLLVAAVAMLICAVFLRTALPTDRLTLAYCFALAMFGNSLPFFLISWGEEEIPSGLAAILMAVMPLTTLVLAHFFTAGDRLSPRKLLGIALGFVGVVVLVGPGVLSGLGDQVIRQLATAGGAICYAIAVIIAQRMPRTPMIGRAAVVLVFSALQTVPLSLYLLDGGIPPMTFDVLWPAIYLGLFPTAMATLVLFKLLSEREASFVAFQNYLVPVFGVLWGALLLGEVVTPQALAALSLILCGIFIANTNRNRQI